MPVNLGFSWGMVLLAVRIGLLGLERVTMKTLGGEDAQGLAATFVFFFISWLALLPAAASQVTHLPWLATVPSAVIYSISFVCLVYALSLGDLAVTGPLVNLHILFLVILATVSGREQLGWMGMAGAVLVVLGSIWIGRGGEPGDTRWSKRNLQAIALVTVHALLLAVGRLTDQTASAGIRPVYYAFTLYSLVTILLGAALLVLGRWREPVRLLFQRTTAAITSGLCNAFSYFLLIVVMIKVPLTVAEPLTALSGLITMVLGWLFFGESLRGRWLPALVIIGGSWLLLASYLPGHASSATLAPLY